MSDRRPLRRLAPPAARMPMPFEIPYHCAEWNLRQGMALMKWQSELLRFYTDRIAADGAAIADLFGLGAFGPGLGRQGARAGADDAGRETPADVV